MPTANLNEGKVLVDRFRNGYRPTDDEGGAWNVADTIDILLGDYPAYQGRGWAARSVLPGLG